MGRKDMNSKSGALRTRREPKLKAQSTKCETKKKIKVSKFKRSMKCSVRKIKVKAQSQKRRGKKTIDLTRPHVHPLYPNGSLRVVTPEVYEPTV